jgi:hypothetical protein
LSSLASAAGYLFAPFFAPALAFVHLYWEYYPYRLSTVTIVTSVFVLAAISVLTGGRTSIMLIVTMVTAVGVIRRVRGQRALPGAKLVVYASAGLLLAAAIGFSLLVFEHRAQGGGRTAKAYAEEMVGDLGGRLTDKAYLLESLTPQASTIGYHLLTTGAYLIHSQWSLETLTYSGERPGFVLFNYVAVIMKRLGLAEQGLPETLLEGRFLTLPGTVYYSWGIAGMTTAAVIQGIAFLLITLFVHRPTVSILGLGVASLSLVVAFLSPLLFAVDVLFFPMIAMAFIMAQAFHWLKVVIRNSLRPEFSELA